MKRVIFVLSLTVFSLVVFLPEPALSASSNNYNVNRVEQLQNDLRESTNRLQQSLKRYEQLQSQYKKENVTLGSINGKYYDYQVLRQLIVLDYLKKNKRFTLADVEYQLKVFKKKSADIRKRLKEVLQNLQGDIRQYRNTGRKHQKELSGLLAQMNQGSRDIPLEDWTSDRYLDELEKRDSVRNMAYNECVPKKYSDRCSKYVKVWYNTSDGRHSLCRNPDKRATRPSHVKCEIRCLCYEYFKSKGGPPKFYP